MKPTTIKKAATALALGSLLTTTAAFAAPGDILFQTEFNTLGDLEGWIDHNDRHIGFDGTGEEDVITNGDGLGVFAAQINAGDPQLRIGGLSIDAATLGKVEARIRKSDGAGGWIAAGVTVNADLVLFTGAGGNQGAPTKTADETTPGDGWTLLEWDAEDVTSGTITDIRWDPLNSGIGDAYEVDYFRLIEGIGPQITAEIDPAGAIPGTFNLVKEWDTIAQLGDLTPGHLEQSLGGTAGVLLQPCSVDPLEDCLFGVSNTNDPTLTSPGGLAIPVAVGENMIIEIGVIGDMDFGTTGSELFWNDGSGGFGGANRIPIAAVPADDALHVIRVSFIGGTGIVTQLNQLRYDPATAIEIDCELDYIRVYTDAPLPSELLWDTNTGTAGAQGGSGDWNTVNSLWNNSVANVSWPSSPTGDDNAVFSDVGGTVTIDAGGITATSLNFTADGYTIDGGTLTLDDSLVAPKLNVDGGSVTATVEALVDGTDDDVRKQGTGTLILDNAANVFNSFTNAVGTTTIPAGASLTTTGTNAAENGFAFKITGGSTLNVDGTIDATAGSFGGFSGDGSWTVNVNSGANLILSDARVGWNASATYNFNDGTTTASGFLRHQDGGTGNINVFGGTHTFGGELGAINNGNNGHTIFTITGGTFSANNTQFTPATGGAGTGNNDYTLNLDGGIFETNRVSIRRGGGPDAGGTNTINLKLNGGTLRALSGGASGTLIDGNIGTAVTISTTVYNATVETGGAKIDTNGENKSVDQPLLVGAASGGNLTKEGAGALYLNEVNTYDGGTLVSAGTLGGEGEVVGDLLIASGAGLAYFENDPGTPTGGLFIGGNLLLPDPLVLSIDSGGGVFTEATAVGLVVADAASIIGSPATITLDTSAFTGLGTWSNPRISGGQVLVDYTAGSDPFAAYMDSFFPGETDPLIVGPDADPDGDGVSNLKEFAFGGNPDSNSDRGPGINGVNDVSGTDYFTRTVAVRTGATFSGTGPMTASQDGVDYSIEGSVDLQLFDSDIVEVTPAILGTLGAAPAGYEYKTFRIDPSVAPGGKGFIGCSVSETP